jgi:beta-glucosidase
MSCHKRHISDHLCLDQGSAIIMPWVTSVPAIVHAWYLGNSSGDAIADVIFGKQNPGGELSLTYPKDDEDVPSYGHFTSQNGEVCWSSCDNIEL